MSWAIILSKYISIKKIEKENDLFLDLYMKADKLSDVAPQSKKFKDSTIAEVFRSGYNELGKLGKKKTASESPDNSNITNIEIRGIDNVERSLNRACTSETTKLKVRSAFSPPPEALVPSSDCSARSGEL